MKTANPPTIMFVPVNTRDGTPKDTLRNIELVPEFVVNLVPHALAAVMNSSVATGTAAIPIFSSFNVSCKLHVVQDPQSARASITASAPRILSITAAGAGLAKVGFISRITVATP